MYLFLHFALKIQNEAVAEGMGSTIDVHAAGKRGLEQEAYVMETFLHRNGPLPHDAEGFLTEVLNTHFRIFRGPGSWHFTSDNDRDRGNLYTVSEVVDRLLQERSKLPFTADELREH